MHRGERVRDVGGRVPGEPAGVLQDPHGDAPVPEQARASGDPRLRPGFRRGDRRSRQPLRRQGRGGARHRAHRRSSGRQVRPRPGSDGRRALHPGLGRPELFGNTFDLDLTVREIVPAGNGQSTLGPEYPLQIVGLVDGARAGAPGGPGCRGRARPAPRRQRSAGARSRRPSPSPVQAPASERQAAPASFPSPFGTPTATSGAHCAAGASCHDAGPFSVTVRADHPGPEREEPGGQVRASG